MWSQLVTGPGRAGPGRAGRVRPFSAHMLFSYLSNYHAANYHVSYFFLSRYGPAQCVVMADMSWCCFVIVTSQAVIIFVMFFVWLKGSADSLNDSIHQAMK